MTRWEYKTLKIETTGLWLGGKVDEAAIDRMLNDYGRQGWELTVLCDTNMFQGESRYLLYTLKRPLE